MFDPYGGTRILTLAAHVEPKFYSTWKSKFVEHQDPVYACFGACAKLAAAAAQLKALVQVQQPCCTHCGEVMRCCS